MIEKRWWKTSRNKLIKNVLLRQELYQYIEWCTIEWHWVKGHNGNVYNEVVDLLAVNAILNIIHKFISKWVVLYLADNRVIIMVSVE